MKKLAGLIHFFPVLLIAVIIIFPLLKPGLIVGGDWTFPMTNSELKVFADEVKSIWSFREIPTGSQITHQNLYLLQIVAGIWARTGLDGISFQKTLLIFTLIGIYFCSYLFFFHITKKKFPSIIASLTYVFSPILFNYLNMGWNYVLLYLALQPLFCLIAYDYFKSGGIKKIIALGLISAIGLFQSQSILWFLIVYFVLFLSQIKISSFKLIFQRFIWGLFVILSITFFIHIPWILPILTKLDYSFTGTTAFDLFRFSTVTSLYNSIRLWGSLYNQQYEFSFPAGFEIFSFFPIAFIIFSFINNKTKKIDPVFSLILGLILIAPATYYLRDTIARLPFSSIIRDSSRFLVISSLGISLGVAVSLKNKINKTSIALVFCLILSAYPFFSGKLYWIKDNAVSSSNTYKDFRLKLLDFPEKSFEKYLAKYDGQRNLFLPTGGFIFTKNDERFSRDFWGIADIQTRFSPYGSGIFYSDKSNPLVSNFTKNYLGSADSWTMLDRISRLYGITNIFYRKGLKSTLTYPLDDPINNRSCENTDLFGSDLAVTSICPISNTYPMIYTSVTPVFSQDQLSLILKYDLPKDKLLTVIGCPEILNLDKKTCNPSINQMASTIPVLTIKKMTDTQYFVHVENITGKYLLVFNQTYHPGWRLTQVSGEYSKNDHTIVNQLVNGWLIDPFGNNSSMDYMIEFYPQKIYSSLIPWSVALFCILLIYVTVSIRLKRKQ